MSGIPLYLKLEQECLRNGTILRKQNHGQVTSDPFPTSKKTAFPQDKDAVLCHCYRDQGGFFFLIILKIYLLWHTNAIWTVQSVSKLWYCNLEKWSTRLYSRWKGDATWSGPYLKGNDPSVACSPESIFWVVKYLGLSTYSWVWPWRIITFCEETGVTLGRNKARTRK